MDSGCKLSAGDVDPDVFDPLALDSPKDIVAVVDQLLCHLVGLSPQTQWLVDTDQVDGLAGRLSAFPDRFDVASLT